MDIWNFITFLGDKFFYLVLISMIYFLYDEKLGKNLMHLTIVSAFVFYGLKITIKEPRPPKYLWKTTAHGYSFPSGHAGASTIFWGYIAYKLRDAYFWFFSLILIFLISASRVVLHVHYIRDVIGGIAIGFLLVFSFVKIERIINNSLEVLGYSTLLVLASIFQNKVPIEGLLLIGFGFGIVVFESMYKFRLKTPLEKLSSFVASYSILLASYLSNSPESLLLGILSSFLPLSFWYTINKRIEKKR